jgi:hypothetical protein
VRHVFLICFCLCDARIFFVEIHDEISRALPGGGLFFSVLSVSPWCIFLRRLLNFILKNFIRLAVPQPCPPSTVNGVKRSQSVELYQEKGVKFSLAMTDVL